MQRLHAQHIRESCRRASTDGLTPTFIRYLAGNHAGYEALLLPLLSSAAPRSKLYLGKCDQEDILMCAELLFKQCQVALTAPKVCQPLSLSPMYVCREGFRCQNCPPTPSVPTPFSFRSCFLATQGKGLCTFLEHLTLLCTKNFF